ncbi:MAG: mechanosensitive ion channel [Candidatus Pacebacteria bacterium]|nr:mechanosensitive ion channel [Candidatus Paceibacterota bacterium]
MINLFSEKNIWEGVTILAIIIFSRILYIFGRGFINRILKDKKREVETLRKTLCSILSILIWTIAITLILPEIGIEFSALIASAGIIGLFLSFGTGNLIKDYFSGLTIIFEDQFNIGDKIEVKNIKGRVIDFDLRKTTLAVGEEEIVYFIPNSEMTIVANLSKKNKK